MRTTLTCLFLATFFLPAPSGMSAVVRWETSQGGNGHYYEAVALDADWATANTLAQSRGGYLATISSPEENAFVFNLINEDRFWRTVPFGTGCFVDGPWIGGMQQSGASEPSGGWGWANGEPFTYSSWAPQQPDNGDTSNQDRIHFWNYSANNSIGDRSAVWDDVEGVAIMGSYIIEWNSNLFTALGEALDATDLMWNTGGETNWTATTKTSHEGVGSAMSGPISHNQSSWLETMVTGPGMLSFWWKVSSEPTNDAFTFFHNGIARTAISGEHGWARMRMPVPASTNSFRWVYKKNVSLSAGLDSGWVDQVGFRQTQSLPLLARMNPIGTESYGKVVVVDDLACVVAWGAGLRLVDVSAAGNPIPRGYLAATCYDAAASGSYVYIAMGYNGIGVVDVSNPHFPKLAGQYNTPGFAHGIAYAKGRVFVADGWRNLQIIDVSDPKTPRFISTLSSTGWALGITVRDNFAYIAEGLVDGRTFRGLRIVDVSNPAVPVNRGACSLPASAGEPFAENVVCLGDTAFVANHLGGVALVNVSDPNNPRLINTFGTSTVDVVDVFASEKDLYVGTTSGGLYKLGIGNPLELEMKGYSSVGCSGVWATNGLIYAGGPGGFYVFRDLSPATSIIESPRRSGTIAAGDFLRFSSRTDQGTEGAVQPVWWFGDGRTSNVEDPGLLQFAEPGEFDVQLDATNATVMIHSIPDVRQFVVTAYTNGLYDLVADRIIIPDSLLAGQSVQISYSASNRGSSPTSVI